jgi:hypothetical protein
MYISKKEIDHIALTAHNKTQQTFEQQMIFYQNNAF